MILWIYNAIFLINYSSPNSSDISYCSNSHYIHAVDKQLVFICCHLRAACSVRCNTPALLSIRFFAVPDSVLD